MATVHAQTQQDAQNTDHLKELVYVLRNFISRAKVPPLAQLATSPSSKFGRNIEQQLLSLTKDDQILALQLRKRNSAVVMSMEHYESIQKTLDSLRRLADLEAARLIEQTGEEYDNLYSRLTSAQSRRAADALFDASAEDLRDSYRPGGTETE